MWWNRSRPADRSSASSPPDIKLANADGTPRKLLDVNRLAKLGWRDVVVLDKGELFEVKSSVSMESGERVLEILGSAALANRALPSILFTPDEKSAGHTRNSSRKLGGFRKNLV